jgi:hypothetical protein
MWLEQNQQRGFMMKDPPTAENLAAYALRVARDYLGRHGIEVISVKFWETPTSCAVCR